MSTHRPRRDDVARRPDTREISGSIARRIVLGLREARIAIAASRNCERRTPQHHSDASYLENVVTDNTLS